MDTFRPLGSVIAAYVAYLIVLAMVVQSFSLANIRGALLAVIWGIFVMQITYLVMHRPKIDFFDEGIRITNPFDEITIGWHLIDEIESKYTMSLKVGKRNIHAWAAPAPGRYHSRSFHPSDIKGLDIGSTGVIRPGDSPRTHSGAAMNLALIRLKNFRSGISNDLIETSIKINRVGLLILILSCSCGVILSFFHF